jgi:hypothetical protein
MVNGNSSGRKFLKWDINIIYTLIPVDTGLNPRPIIDTGYEPG